MLARGPVHDAVRRTVVSTVVPLTITLGYALEGAYLGYALVGAYAGLVLDLLFRWTSCGSYWVLGFCRGCSCLAKLPAHSRQVESVSPGFQRSRWAAAAWSGFRAFSCCSRELRRQVVY